MQFWKGANGQQTGDPAKLAKALVTIANEEKPPLRFLAGADAVATDRTGGDLDDGIATMLDFRVRHGFAPNVAFAMPSERLHRLFLRRAGPAIKPRRRPWFLIRIR